MPIHFTIDSVWNRDFSKPIYTCGIANLIGDPKPEVIGCSFDATMSVFDMMGDRIWTTKFSPEITNFISASLISENRIELLSGDINGNVRLLKNDGALLWSTKLNSAIIGMDLGDLLGNGKKTIILALENQKVILLDSTGNLIGEYTTPEPVIDCTIIESHQGYVGEIVVLLKSGKVMIQDRTGNWEELFSFPDFTSITTIHQMGKDFLVVGDRKGILRILTRDGYSVGEKGFGAKIRCVRKNSPLSAKESQYLAVAADDRLFLCKLQARESRHSSPSIISQGTLKLGGEVTKKSEELESPVKKQPSPSPASAEKKDTKEKSEKNRKTGVSVLRGGQIEGDRFVFKIKVVNESNYNITDVNIQILSYPYESLILEQTYEQTRVDSDRIKVQKINPGGFISPTFSFSPKSDCIKGKIRGVVNFLNERDEIQTIIIDPYEIRMICGLLKPKEISNDDFDKLSENVLSFSKMGEEFTVPFNPEGLFEKLLTLLKTKNFAIVDTEKKTIGTSFFGVLKGFAEGSFSQKKLGLQVTLTGHISEHSSLLKIETYSEDKDMSPPLIAEIEDSITYKVCANCGYPIPPELGRRILKGIETYCESCGSPLHISKKKN